MAINVQYGNGGAALDLLYQGVKKKAGADADQAFIAEVGKQRQDRAQNYATSIQQAIAADQVQADANLQNKRLTMEQAERQHQDEVAAQTRAADAAANNQRLAFAQRDQQMQERRFTLDESRLAAENQD